MAAPGSNLNSFGDGITRVTVIGGVIKNCTLGIGLNGDQLINAVSSKRIELGFSDFEETFNLSDPTIYDVTTFILTIPPTKIYAGIFNLSVDLYDSGGVYVLNNVVRSDGSFGGVAGKSYKNLTGANAGVLNDANWDLADIADLGAGTVQIDRIIGTSISFHPITIQGNDIFSISFKPGTFGALFAGDMTTTAGAIRVIYSRLSPDPSDFIKFSTNKVTGVLTETDLINYSV